MSKKIFYCNRINTLNEECPHAQAILVSDGRIEFIGTREALSRYIYIYIYI